MIFLLYKYGIILKQWYTCTMIQHIPILVQEIIDHIPTDTTRIFDATLWHAWHSIAFAREFPHAHIDATDVDDHMIDVAKKNIAQSWCLITIYHTSYTHIDSIATQPYDFILIDLGANLEHFKNPNRWFSIKQSWPLDMRFDQSSGMPAAQWLKSAHWSDLQKCLMDYADMWERMAQKYALNILKELRPIKNISTWDLVTICKKLWYSDHTIVLIFQAIRIYINHEFDHISQFFDKVLDCMSPYGKIAILTFHSWEESLVIQWYKKNKKALKNCTPNPILPSVYEQSINKASRSAKCRIYQKW